MLPKRELVERLAQAAQKLLDDGMFQNGWTFRPTQREALEAGAAYWSRKSYSLDTRLRGYFEIPQGVGKTAMFAALIDEVHRHAQNDGIRFRSVVVVPTNHLMYQTYWEFAGRPERGQYGVAPRWRDHIGFYGDEHKDLSKPITIMNYVQWKKLIEDNELDSNNVDLLISDEGHKGTSEKCIDYIRENFWGKTACIAFTATGSYDLEKGVKQSHEKRIFYKSITDSLKKDGELASYIETQLHIIRTMEPTQEMYKEFARVARKGIRGKYAWRDIAWNQKALELLVSGVDTVSDERLVDKEKGLVFVRNTAQADHFAWLANNHPPLQELARERGLKQVAVSIHSYQEDTYADIVDFKGGDYFIAVGDDIFKEGFDDKKVKFIIDSDHGSLVDKSQILGRGSRQWRNLKKDNRYEGLVVIDTLQYVGSDDPKEDKKNLDKVKKNAVIAHDILGNSVVLGPHYERKDSERERHYPLPIFGPDVTSYYDCVAIQQFVAERSKLRREGYIPFTKEMQKYLQSENERTGLGAVALISNAEEPPPPGLSAGVIDRLLKEGVRVVDEDHWAWIVRAYKNANMIALDDEKRTLLKTLIDQAGVRAYRIISKSEDVPKGLTAGNLHRALMGQANKMKLTDWNWLTETLPKFKKVELTPELVTKIKKKQDETGIKATLIFKLAKTPPPKGLSVGIINGWTRGKITSALNVHLDWFFNSHDTIGIRRVTDEMRKELNAEMKRTGLGVVGILNLMDKIPEGLDAKRIAGWKTGHSKTADAKCWEKVMETCKKSPDRDFGKKSGSSTGHGRKTTKTSRKSKPHYIDPTFEPSLPGMDFSL